MTSARTQPWPAAYRPFATRIGSEPMGYKLDIDLHSVSGAEGSTPIGAEAEQFTARLLEVIQAKISEVASSNPEPPDRIVLHHPSYWSDGHRGLAMEAVRQLGIPANTIDWQATMASGADYGNAAATVIADSPDLTSALPASPPSPPPAGTTSEPAASPSSPTDVTVASPTPPGAPDQPLIRSRAGSRREAPPHGATQVMPQEALEAFRQSDAEGAPAGGSSRRWIVIAVTAALVVFGLGFMAWGSLASLGGSTEAEGLGDEERPDSGDTDTEQGEDTPGSVTTESVPSSEAPMPDVVGSSIEDAEATLDQLGLTVEVIEDATLTRPAGQVAHQSITVGALVSEGETVTLTVSTGEGVGLVPYVIGMSEVQALDVLDKAGFTDVRVVSIPDNETPAGQVVRTNPEPGSDHDPDRTFVVFVSKGSGAIAEVPDVVGLTQAEAVAALIDADLRFSIEFVDLADESPAAGRVVEQDPEAGSERPSGFTVELRIGR